MLSHWRHTIYRRTALLTHRHRRDSRSLEGLCWRVPNRSTWWCWFCKFLWGLLSFSKRESQDNAVCLRWNMLCTYLWGRVWSYDLSFVDAEAVFGSGLSRGNCTDVRAILDLCGIVLWVCNASNSWVLFRDLFVIWDIFCKKRKQQIMTYVANATSVNY